MSKDKITVKMVEQKYRAGIQAFARTLGDPTLRLNFMQEADPFFRRCALAVRINAASKLGCAVGNCGALWAPKAIRVLADICVAVARACLRSRLPKIA